MTDIEPQLDPEDEGHVHPERIPDDAEGPWHPERREDENESQ